MRKQMLFRLGAVLFFVLSGLGSRAEDSTTAAVNVVSWNIEWFPGRLPKAPIEQQRAHMEAAKTVLADLAPDLLLLQEMADWPAVMELASVVPGLQVHVVSQFDNQPQNLAIASKLPMDSAWYERWKDAPPSTPPRGFAFAALELPGQRFLLVYTVHYKSNHGQPAENFAKRQQASRQLLEHVREMLEVYSRRGECAVLIGGDFNSSMDDPQFIADLSVRAIDLAGFSWAHEGIPFENRITWSAADGFADTCFDHLFVLGGELASMRVPHFPEISDHNPIVAIYRFPAGAAAELNLIHLDDVAAASPEANANTRATAPGQSAANNSPASMGGALDVENVDQLRKMAGRDVRVRGTVRRIGKSPSGSLVFINFGFRRGDFTAIVRRQNVDAVKQIAQGSELEEFLPGRRVEIQGRIELFRGDPQIEVRRADQIRML